ncbi:glycosyltransferase family 4 protein [Mesobacillus maritimus]|uniref:glycosyltransferase family 4 protein n=1 Tax=Mesobacillus maritimus TaxID=1643336 RepID=UPI00203DEC54|nr:glycosyltransferase family 4 protein [Mesobacillus maritimus]MCM3587308.1 glycosyltransferase family 4 protein [Mesobacillus maritimus]
MRIGLFTDTYFPQINGVVSSICMLKENLEKLGHQVFVFTITDPTVTKDEPNIYRVPSLPFAKAWRLGMFYHPRLARTIKRLQLDVIHTHTEFSLGIFGRAMARELQIPLLHTYHTIFENYTHYIVKFPALEPIAKSAVRKISANFCNAVDRVIVPTEKVKDLLLSYQVRQKISVIPTGIQLHKFSNAKGKSNAILKIRADLGIRQTDRVLLYVGRLAVEKNIGELIESLKSYLHQKQEMKFVLIGDGPAKGDLEEMTKSFGIQEQTFFVGEKPYAEIGDYYQLGDVFISASQSETQGLTYIEAMASGLPVVAKADRCLDGVLENNVNGFTFRDKHELQSALDWILSNDFEKERLSHGAIHSVEKFSDVYYAKKIEAIYQHVWNVHVINKKVS